ncbi:RHS repeat-associated core domain-containing protein, partial [Frigoribacterium sp. CFBP 13712]|uniref:RHS repeat-associated core domain-containing protein n=1 Tax=Frigoribacterium sp. CFBP 13712 TaxID=2775309 RepID=UPI001781378F
SVFTLPGGATQVGEEWLDPAWRGARATDATDPWGTSRASAALPGLELPGGASLTATGGLQIGGLEWLGARVYDPAARGFLSVDPLAPVTGAGWAGNPYSYAGNDPMHAIDPLGLRPATDADLDAYAAANQSVIGRAGDWWSENWEYVAAGAAIVAGVALMFTGVGGPAGVALLAASGAMLSGGISIASQKATTGEVDWGRVGVDAAIGGVGGGLGAGAGLAVAARGGSAVARNVAEVVVDGVASNAAGYATSPGPHTVDGFIRSTASSAATGLLPAGAGSAINRIAPVGSSATNRLGDLVPTNGLSRADASTWMSAQGIPDVLHRQTIDSFETGTMRIETAGPDTYGIRHYGGQSEARGYYLTPTLPATRSELALPNGNTMQHLAQFKIPQGSEFLSGRVGPNFGHPGGGIQYVVPDKDILERIE